MTEISWNTQLVEQVDFLWNAQVRPRLDGLTDEEYLWEPAPGGWNLRPRGTTDAPVAAGSGAWQLDYASPTPEPAPVTSIAWRLGHVIVGVLAMRNASHFGGVPTDYDTFEYAGTAGAALAQLDQEYAVWLGGVRSLGEEGLARPCGPAEGPFAEEAMATLVLHINRELIHHLAEVCLLRDLWGATHP